VVVSTDEATGGVVAYDMGKLLADGSFQDISILNPPPQALRSAVAALVAEHHQRENLVPSYINAMLAKYPLMKKGFSRPKQSTDRLFKVDYEHANGRTCDGCDTKKEVEREPRYDESPVIHYGTIATGDSVIMHAPTREGLKQRYNAICLDMEAAGLTNNFPCIVIRGISNYADSHKNKHWDKYAAAVAAGYAKELLQWVQPKEIDMTPAAQDVLDKGTNSNSSGGWAVTKITR
jgi:hypothetical protein